MPVVARVTALRPGANVAWQGLLTLGLVAAIVAGVLVLDGEPPGVEGSTPYAAAAAGLLLGAAEWIRRRGQVPVRLVRRGDGRHSVVIADRVRPIELALPLGCYACRTWRYDAERPNPVLMLALLDDNGAPRILLEELLSYWKAPPPWPEGTVAAPTTYKLIGWTASHLEAFWHALEAAGATLRTPTRPPARPGRSPTPGAGSATRSSRT